MTEFFAQMIGNFASSSKNQIAFRMLATAGRRYGQEAERTNELENKVQAEARKGNPSQSGSRASGASVHPDFFMDH